MEQSFESAVSIVVAFVAISWPGLSCLDSSRFRGDILAATGSSQNTRSGHSD